MIALRVQADGIAETVDFLRRMVGLDLNLLAERLAPVLINGNRRRAERGLGGKGETLTPLRSKRKGKYKGATGPPLAPFGPDSRSANVSVAIEMMSEDHARITLSWDDMPWLIAHIRGDFPLPVRDIAHIDPETWDEVHRTVGDFIEESIARGWTA